MFYGYNFYERGVNVRRKDREVTNMEDIRSIIEKCKVCHLAMTDGAKPYVVPLSFGYKLNDEALTLYFHSAKTGRKIDILSKCKEVCFDMAFEGRLGLFENPCNSGYYFESIIGFGEAEFVDDDDEKCEALTLLMKRQTNKDFVFTKQQADTVCVFKVVSQDFTGKKKPDPSGNAL
jgi:Predicted flavin-nucleotide-binding protein